MPFSPLGGAPDVFEFAGSVVSTTRSNRSTTVAAMGMRCSRVGCGGHAVASFCFDGRAALVWLDPLDPDRGVGAGVLCARHADTLTPPEGLAPPGPPHAGPRASGSTARPSPTLRSRPLPLPGSARRSWHPERNPEPDVAPARVLVAHTDPLPFPTEVTVSARAEAEPRYVATAEPSNLDELLDARSPLLARAFAEAKAHRAERREHERAPRPSGV